MLTLHHFTSVLAQIHITNLKERNFLPSVALLNIRETSASLKLPHTL